MDDEVVDGSANANGPNSTGTSPAPAEDDGESKEKTDKELEEEFAAWQVRPLFLFLVRVFFFSSFCFHFVFVSMVDCYEGSGGVMFCCVFDLFVSCDCLRFCIWAIPLQNQV